VGDTQDESRNFAGVAAVLGVALYKLSKALAAFLVRRVGIECALSDAYVAGPDVGVERAGLDQHHANAKGVGFNAQRFAPAFKGVLGAAIGAKERGSHSPGDGANLDDVSGLLATHHGN